LVLLAASAGAATGAPILAESEEAGLDTFDEPLPPVGPPTTRVPPSGAYGISVDVSRHTHARGASADVASPALKFADDSLRLRGNIGYGTFVVVGPETIGGSGPTTGDVALLNGGATLEILGAAHHLPGALLPQIAVDALYGGTRKNNLTSRNQAVGGSGSVLLELPLVFDEDFAEPEESRTDMSVVVSGSYVGGLPRADKLVGGPDLLNGWVASLGFRFYL
jgi:hypothetical protein